MRLSVVALLCAALSGCGGMGAAMGELALRSVLSTGMSILGDLARQSANRAAHPGFVAPLDEGRLSP